MDKIVAMGYRISGLYRSYKIKNVKVLKSLLIIFSVMRVIR